MIIDCRTYEIKVGRMDRLLELYEQRGLEVQTRHLGPPIGYYTTQIGPLNQMVHMWAYESLADRTRRRAALESDVRWREYLRAAGQLDAIVQQENKILTPTRFFRPCETSEGGA